VPDTTAKRRSARRWFLAWLAVGAGLAFGLLGAMSIGLLVLPVAVIAAVLLARRPAAGGGIAGLVSGLGVAPLFVAYINRAGPGTICTTTARSVSCVQEWSPWPWLTAGVVLLGGGVVWFRRRALRSTGLRDCA
jgi:hypothetical protein